MITRLLLTCVAASYLVFLWRFTYGSFYIGPPPHDSVGALLWTVFMASVLLGAVYLIWRVKL